MSDDTKRILKMVAAGKITADEGERLLAGLAAGQSASPDDRGNLRRLMIEKNPRPGS